MLKYKLLEIHIELKESHEKQQRLCFIYQMVGTGLD